MNEPSQFDLIAGKTNGIKNAEGNHATNEHYRAMKKSYQRTKVIGLAMCLATLPILGLVSGCAGDRYHQSTGEDIDDHATSMRVKSALAGDADYKYQDVKVQTFKGVVQLSGFVDTRTQKSRAEELAKNVPDVRSVENNITVKE